ncbi:MAG: hypothetical protein M1819_006118 [Sarea resinae]|nr:MAG: hypothetical protein M1819_006118 [Sarea resinae]
MDKIRISKVISQSRNQRGVRAKLWGQVDHVHLVRRGISMPGTIHLTQHYLIFSHTPSSPTEDTSELAAKARAKELWITYPMISLCTYRPAPPASHQKPSIRLRGRDFTFVAFQFLDEKSARAVYDSVKSLTCKLGRVEKLFAFSFRSHGPEKDINGWTVYDAREEWKRLGVNEKSVDNGWRLSKINIDYQYSPTYPALLAVPSAISDNVLNYAGRYRSRARIPVLTYLHPINNCTITRSSQPLVGVRGNRSIQDEKLVAAIFSSSTKSADTADISSIPSSESSTPGSSQKDGLSSSRETDMELLEDQVIAQAGNNSKPEDARIYGAQQHNLIVDARPTVNAYAMQAVGLGSENMDNYPFATKAYLGIDNIHVMRESLNKVVEALKDSDLTPLAPNREVLSRSGWLKHISSLLDGSGLIARQVGLQHSHVLIHCSDGWDRTSQLSSLSQLCLDPYYRTLEGFIVLVEKDWLSFGHMFRHRSGFLNSEKWFTVENERIGGASSSNGGPNSKHGGGSNAFENAFLSAKGFFNKDNTSRDSLAESDSELPFDSPPSKKPTGDGAAGDKEITKVKETSPVFHQFLDATYQLLYQHPTRFEFNERFLKRLLYHLYSCQYGTFLYNNEKERIDAKVQERTSSVWDYFLARKEQFLNDKYDPTIDDHDKKHERMIFPRLDEVRWWHDVFGRTDEEMNGPALGSGVGLGSGVVTGVLTGVETADNAVGSGTPGKMFSTPRNSGVGGFGAGLAAMGASRGKTASSGRSGAAQTTTEMEVEMQ